MYRKIALGALGVTCVVLGLLLFPVAQSNFAYYFWQKDTELNQGNQAFCKYEEGSAIQLCMPKLHIHTQATQEADLKSMQSQLKNGVTHLAGSAGLGEEGNAVYFGQSDDYFWEKGPAKTIFSTLNQLQVDDSLYFLTQNKTLHYRVRKTSLVSPKDLSVLENNSNNKEVTLITCWPPGTTLRRLVVSAELQE